MELSPTLWRTCRMLTGSTRLDLLRRIIETPGQTVSDLTKAADLSETRASQELRRLQSRGLVQAERSGRWVRYRPAPDPRVPSSALLLAAMKAAMTRRAPEAHEQVVRIAKAFGHERRLRMVHRLSVGPCRGAAMQYELGIPAVALARHMRLLKAGGIVRRGGAGWELAPNPHPLAKCVTGLVTDRKP